MDHSHGESSSNRRMAGDRRSGEDTRSDIGRQVIGERRSGLDRRSERTAVASDGPSSEQLALFTRRLRRALGSQKSRDVFGVASSEYEFAVYPDVLRTLEWLESLTITAGRVAASPTKEKIGFRKPLSRSET